MASLHGGGGLMAPARHGPGGALAVARSSVARLPRAQRVGHVRCDAEAMEAMEASTRRQRWTRRRENANGPFFVDDTCIDCDVCRQLAPCSFSRMNGQSAVHHQPVTPSERHAALQALLACPTHSIRSEEKPIAGLREAEDSFPLRIAEGIYLCGFTSAETYAAQSYLLRGTADGNVLVDCPRWTPALVRQIEALGGIDVIFLTHRDDVYGHGLWAQRFGAKRVIHGDEASASAGGGLGDCELKLVGDGPWRLTGDGGAVDGPPDAPIVIKTPGHTIGHCVLFWPSRHALFTGDTLSYSDGLGRLYAFRDFCWHSFETQLRSLVKLRGLDFTHVLPGHGRRHAFSSSIEKDKSLDRLLEAETYRDATGHYLPGEGPPTSE